MAKGKKVQRRVEGEMSPGLVFGAAKAHHDLALRYIVALPTDPACATKAAQSWDVGELVASATNIILALELYLKTLLIAADRSVPTEHDLVILFGWLPKDNRNELARYY